MGAKTMATIPERVRRKPLHPPFRWWHAALLLLAIGLGVLSVGSPGVMADVAGVDVMSWQPSIYLRGFIWILAVYALIGVRVYSRGDVAALIGVLVALSFRGGYVQITQESLSVSGTLTLLVLAWVPLRIIVRPSMTERLRALAARNEALTAERDAFADQCVRLKAGRTYE